MLVLWALELVSNYGVHAFGVGKQIPNLFTICWWENGSNVFVTIMLFLQVNVLNYVSAPAWWGG